ncbi:hypothetical protein CHH80_00670 [Bacillus sp. 7504-2]|nr:hypothetical protein CHH80_00670 [Bacillus sp. 7504-2]
MRGAKGVKCMPMNRSIVMSENQKEMNESLRKLYNGLQPYCRFLTRSKWDGDDLAQESLVRAVQNYPVSQLHPSLLKKIAFHFWIDTMRRKKINEVEWICDQHSEAKVDPSAILETVQKLLEKLTPKQAVIFFLHEAFLFRIKEIAELLNMTETGIKAILYRARRRLEKGNTAENEPNSLSEKDTSMLIELMCQSLLEEEPHVLIEHLPHLPMFTQTEALFRTRHSNSPLHIFRMAA